MLKEMKAVSAQAVSHGAPWQAVVLDNPQKSMQHMHGNIPYTFDYWADLGVHLLLLKCSMGYLKLRSNW